MFEEGTIIYFDPFYFKNGNPAKPKYFVVLKRLGQKSILAALPTRKDSIPAEKVVEFGCLELPDINLNCFVISSHDPATTCGKHFDFTTHIYGYQLDDYDVNWLSEIYPNEGTDYEIWGLLKSEIYDALIACLKNSRSVKMKYKRVL